MIKQSHIAFAPLMFLEETRSVTYTDKKYMADWKPKDDCKSYFSYFAKSSLKYISIKRMTWPLYNVAVPIRLTLG